MLKADVHHAVEEGARAKHDSLRAETEARLGHDARNAAVFDDQVINGLLEDAEVLLAFNALAHGAAVKLTVDLGAGGLNGGTLGAVENAELNAGLVSHDAHGARPWRQVP